MRTTRHFPPDTACRPSQVDISRKTGFKTRNRPRGETAERFARGLLRKAGGWSRAGLREHFAVGVLRHLTAEKLRRIPARLIGIGFRPSKAQSFEEWSPGPLTRTFVLESPDFRHLLTGEILASASYVYGASSPMEGPALQLQNKL